MLAHPGDTLGYTCAAADLDGGKVLVGRLDLRKAISTAVSNERYVSAHPITSSHSSYRGSTSAVPTPGATTPSTNVSATASNGTNHNNVTGVVSSCDVVRRTVKSIVGDTVPKHFLFSSNPTGAYFPWRVALCDLLRHRHSLPNDVAAEVALHFITEPLKSNIRNKVSRDAVIDNGISAVWTVMDKRYSTNLEFRSLENSLDALSQEPSESTLDYCTRFEKLWHVKQSVVPDEAAQDSSIIRRLKRMDFDTFKDTLLAVIDDLPDINSLTKSVPKSDKNKGRNVDDDPNVRALCIAAAAELGLAEDSCLCCGKPGHVAARCKASPDQIIRKDERCKRFGRLADSQHRFDSNKFHCKRYRRADHLALSTAASNCLTTGSNSTEDSMPSTAYATTDSTIQ
ncbi:hypothetical protein FOL46_001772, partial [Perkinsus olseni]